MGVKTFKNGAWEEVAEQKKEMLLYRYRDLENLIFRFKEDCVSSIRNTELYLSEFGYLDLTITFTLAKNLKNGAYNWDSNAISELITINSDVIASKLGITERYFYSRLNGHFSTNGVTASNNYAMATVSHSSYSGTNVLCVDLIRTSSDLFTLEAGDNGFLYLQGFCCSYKNV